jgi:hypothetical protein
MLVVAQSMVVTSARAVCADEYASPACKRTWPGTRLELLAADVTLGNSETNFAAHIQAGLCGTRGVLLECDGVRLRDGSVLYLARSYYQLHQNRSIEWESIVGLEPKSVTEATWAATRALSAARNYCAKRSKRGWVAGMFSNLATGNSCEWSGASARRKTFGDIHSQLLRGISVGVTQFDVPQAMTSSAQP